MVAHVLLGRGLSGVRGRACRRHTRGARVRSTGCRLPIRAPEAGRAERHRRSPSAVSRQRRDRRRVRANVVGASVDRDHHWPLKALRAENNDDLDSVAFGVDLSFIVRRAVSPFFGEIAEKLLQSAYPIGPRTFYKSLDVGRRAGAAVAFAGGENWSDRQTLDGFGEEQRRRGRPCTSPDVMQNRQRSTSKRMPRKSWTQFGLLPWHIPEFFMLVTHRPVR
jgi:hypothetical protein